MKSVHQKLAMAAESAVRAAQNGLDAAIRGLDQSKSPPGRPAAARAGIPAFRAPTESVAALEHRERALLQQTDDPAIARVRLERILAGNELTDVNYLSQGLSSARSVCRIVLRSQGRVVGYGTGFLVAPGVLLTNHHVLSSLADVTEAIAQFRFERTIHGTEVTPVEFSLQTTPAPILYEPLDFALAGVAGRLSGDGTAADFGWLRLNPQPGKAFIGEYLTIIQHPNGERKQICVRENRLLKYEENGPFLWYQTDTVGGSSGSPVFNNSWEVVALHHSGVPRTRSVNGRLVWLNRNGQPWTRDQGDDAVDWIANEGVRISRILNCLETRFNSHPLARQVLQAAPAPWMETASATESATDAIDGIRIQETTHGTMRVLIPVEIGIRIPGANTQSPAAQRPVGVTPADNNGNLTGSDQRNTAATEVVEIDTTNYHRRNGYRPDFLGEESLKVPLPKLKAAVRPDALKIKGQSTELKYWNYSVVMCQSRGLAFFSAANINPALWKGNRSGNEFIRDQRVDAVDAKAQIGEEFYKKQKLFEGTEDRSKNPFDQGHLTRREDLQWGSTDRIAKRNGDDSFHFTNCAPQHFEFNQARKVNGIWNRLEQMTAEIAGEDASFCVFNGPIFDAPPCTELPDGTLELNLKGSSSPDLLFGGIRIPKLYFKVIVWPHGDSLRTAAFVVTQEALLKKVSRLHAADELSAVEAGLTDEEVRLYQVTLEDLEEATSLDFGRLTSLPFQPLESTESAPRFNLPISSEFDIRF